MAPKGKFFRFKSQLNGLYLDVKGGSTSPGAEVITWEGNSGDNQIWFHHPQTKTIRSKASGLCLDTSNGKLATFPYQSGKVKQLWVYNSSKDVIESVGRPGVVLDIANQNRQPGAELCEWEYNGGANQKWVLEPVGAPTYFYIRTDLCGDKVLDVHGGRVTSGTRVNLYEKKYTDRDNQLWYEDYLGNIRPKLDDNLVLDGSGGELKLSAYNPSNSRGFWFIDGHRIASFHDQNQVLDVKDGRAHDNNPICVWMSHGGSNQKWHFDSV